MIDLPSICQHGTSKKTKVMNISACVDTCVHFLPVSSAAGTEVLQGCHQRMRKNEETEVKCGVRFPKHGPFYEVFLAQTSNSAK